MLNYHLFYMTLMRLLSIALFIILTSCSSQNEPQATVANPPISVQPQPEELLTSKIYKSIKLSDNELMIRVDEIGNLNIYFNNEKITDDLFIKYDIALNEHGDYLWLQTTYSNNQSELYLRGEKISEDFSYISSPIMSNDAAYWIQHDFTNDYICKYLLGENPLETTSCIKTEHNVSSIKLLNNSILSTQYDSVTSEHSIKIYDLNLLFINQYQTDDSLLIGPGGEVIKVRGNSAGQTLFFAYAHLFGNQYGEPFSYGNDFMGRLSFNQSYRFLALNKLSTTTNNKSLDSYTELAVNNLINTLGDSCIFSSKKYSIDKEQEASFQVNNAMIWYSVLSNYASLNSETQEIVMQKAQCFYNYMEQNWVEEEKEYRFSKQPQIKFDGIFLPWNQQNAIGLFILQLYKIDNNSTYLARAIELYHSFYDDINSVNGVFMWHYWPSKFYLGWNSGDYDSINSPTRSARNDSLYSDLFHSQLSIEFLHELNKVAGLDISKLDLDMLWQNINQGDNLFSLFLSGNTSAREASWNYLPKGSFLNSSNIQELYSKFIVQSLPEYDNQLLFYSYAYKLALMQDSATELKVEISQVIYNEESNTFLDVAKKNFQNDIKSLSHQLDKYFNQK